MGFSIQSGKESTCQCRTFKRYGSGRFPGVRNGTPDSSIPAWKISWAEEPGGICQL